MQINSEILQAAYDTTVALAGEAAAIARVRLVLPSFDGDLVTLLNVPKALRARVLKKLKA